MAQPLPWQIDASKSAYVQHLKSQQVSRRVLAAALRDAAIDAERAVAAIVDPRVGAQMRRAQLQAVTLALRENQAALWSQVSATTRSGIASASQAAVEGSVFYAEYLTRAAADPRLAGQLVSAAHYSVEVVRAKILNDVKLSPLVYKNREVGIRRAQRVVTRGLAQNRSAKEIASRVRHLINPNTPGGVSYAAMRLARTEINNAYHGISTEWNNRTPFVEAVKWELSNGHGSPDICDEFADQDDYNLGRGVWVPQDVPHKPHPHCLCYTIAITPSPDQFIESLTSGKYDTWLSEQGQAPISIARMVG